MLKIASQYVLNLPPAHSIQKEAIGISLRPLLDQLGSICVCVHHAGLSLLSPCTANSRCACPRTSDTCMGHRRHIRRTSSTEPPLWSALRSPLSTRSSEPAGGRMGNRYKSALLSAETWESPSVARAPHILGASPCEGSWQEVS